MGRQSELLTAANTRDPILSKRAGIEMRYINQVKKLSKNAFLLPWQPDAPVGVEHLQELVEACSIR
jgi:hypothetical protein